ncbi:MAG: DUF5329 family protein [Alphaproteobacteria bacterium]
MGNARILSLLPLLFALTLTLVLPTKARADWREEQYKITYLLNVVRSSDLVFIRNGVEYPGKTAEAFLEKKMAMVGMRVHTAEDFIHYVASSSSTTETPYYVRFADGTQIEAGLWLQGQLDEMK